MIIIQYLVKETLKSQFSILCILFLIFSTQKIINILSGVVNGSISIDLIFPLLGFGLPEMAGLIFPLSLLFGLSITYSKLYIDNEITVMHACGFGKNILIITALILSLFTTFIAIVNIVWILPLSAKYQEEVLADAKANPNLVRITEGQFKTTKDQNIVLYISNVKGKNFTDLFMAQLRPVSNQAPYVVIAKTGTIQKDKSDNQIVVLDKGTRYEGTPLLCNFRITDFKNYQAVIHHKKSAIITDKIEQKEMLQLWNATDPESKAEFHWRLTLVVAVVIMALIVVPLSKVNLKYGKALNMLPCILVYLLFFLLQTTLHSSAEKGEIDPKITMWLVNTAFLLLGIILNIWDSIFIRQLRNRLYKGTP